MLLTMPTIDTVRRNAYGWAVWYRLADGRPRCKYIQAPNRDAACANVMRELKERYW